MGTFGPKSVMSDSSFRAVAPYYDLLMASVPYRMWVEYLKMLFEIHEQEPFELLDIACSMAFA
jgi:hypothetical protein